METKKFIFQSSPGEPGRGGFRLSGFGGALAILTFPISISLSQLGLVLALIGWAWWSISLRRARAVGGSTPGHGSPGMPADTWVMPWLFPRELKFGLGIYAALFFSLVINAIIAGFDTPAGSSAAAPGAWTRAGDFLVAGLRDELKDVLLVLMAFWVLAYTHDERGRARVQRLTIGAAYILVVSGFISIFSKFRLAKIPHHIKSDGWDPALWIGTAAARLQHHAGSLFAGTSAQFDIFMPVGFMGTHLTYAALLGFAFPFLFFRVLHPFVENPRSIFRPRPIFHGLVLLAAVWILVLNNGRSALLGIGIAILCGLYYFTRVYWQKKILRLVPIALIAILLAGALYTVSPGVGRRFQKIVGALTGQTKHTDWQRTFLWRGTHDIIRRNPVLGVGPGEFKAEINRTILRFSKSDPHLWYAYAVIQRGHAHNDVFHLMAIGGIAAATIYLVFFALLFYRLMSRAVSLDQEYWKWGVLCIFAAGLYQCYFQDDEVLLPFWLFTALAIRGTMPSSADEGPKA